MSVRSLEHLVLRSAAQSCRQVVCSEPFGAVSLVSAGTSVSISALRRGKVMVRFWLCLKPVFRDTVSSIL